MQIFSLKGKTALIVGGSRGLGKGMATGLAAAGAEVILVSRSQADCDAAAADITAKTGSKAIGIGMDIKSVAGVNAVVDKAIAEFGKIDILMNAAGINIRMPSLEYTEEAWDDVLDTQLKYVFFMCQAVAKTMIAKGIKGRIINIASLSSVIGLPNIVPYCGAKGAIVQITKALAQEWAPHGINVNAIGPGYYETTMTKAVFEDKARTAELLNRIPLNRFGFPEDLEGAAVFLASAASEYVTGQTVYVDGGFLAK